MKCIKCNIGTDKAMLHRTNPKGESPAGWMCLNCIHKYEPELAKNIEADLNNEPIFKTLSNLPNLI